MKPQWESLLNQINSAYQNWQDVYSVLPATFDYQGINISISDLNVSFAEIVGMVNFVATSEEINPILLAVHQPVIINTIPQLVQVVANLRANPQPHLEQLSSHLWSIRSSLVWIMPVGTNEYFEKHIQNSNVMGLIESTQNLINHIKSLSESGTNSFNQITNLELTAQELIVKINQQHDQSEVEVQEILNKISGYEREASSAKITADANATLVLINKEKVEDLLEKITSGLNQQQEAQEKINLLSNEAELVLEGTSKAGLAASFRSRRESLETSQKLWIAAFAVGIFLLIGIAISTSTGYFKLPDFINTDGQVNAWAVIARMLITGPGIWFTWFVVRQYGFTMRLIEDYAFKEASALAFVGYKREMGEDEEMLKLLRETAIKNFGASPTRMLSKSEPSSPVHELVDKALENQGVFDKLLQLFKALKSDKN